MERTSRNEYRGVQMRKETRFGIYLRDRFECQYCSRDLHNARPMDVTLDHLKPRCKGGTNDPRNLVTACRRCNCSRKDRSWREFADGEAIQRIKRSRRRVVNRNLAKAIIEDAIPTT